MFLDEDMPDISGLKVLAIIRADPAMDGIPIILHTAICDPELDVEARKLGAYRTMIKGSYKIDELVAVIKQFAFPGDLTPPVAA
ncbi:MAG: Response regulator receiver domain [Phycisphaerales bacterium]|nr:Response regulator receiver domain [Phycisphaerales bacterium]